jgi:integrase
MDAQWKRHAALEKAGTICPYVFHRAGKQNKCFRGAWEAAREKAGHPGRLRHDFRRSAARNFVRSGTPDTVAMKITGHKTRSVFDRYITSSEDVRQALGSLKSTMGTNHEDKSPHASSDAKTNRQVS